MWTINTIVRDLTVNVMAGLLSGAVIFLVGLRWRLVSSFLSRERAAFRRLFGPKATEAGFITVTVDTYRDLRLLPPSVLTQLGIPTQSLGPSGVGNVSGGAGTSGGRYYKIFPDGHLTAFPGAFEELLGYCSARAAAYLVDKLSGIGNGTVRAVSDGEIANRWDGTFINLGSSASNVKTNDIKHLPENRWLLEDIKGKFEFKDNSEVVIDIKGDKGIILKIANPYIPGYSLLVCAGLGEWGTSGAAWYLSRHWRSLSRRFKMEPFLIVVNVSQRSDESAQEIRYFGKESTSWRVFQKVGRALPFRGQYNEKEKVAP